MAMNYTVGDARNEVAMMRADMEFEEFLLELALVLAPDNEDIQRLVHLAREMLASQSRKVDEVARLCDLYDRLP